MNISGIHLLDWAIIATSFFNTIAMLWLGLTVLLNAERRSWGTWIAGGGLLCGGLFYAGHSAVVGRVLGTFESEMNFWWRVSWLPITGVPFLWYAVIASYTGVTHTHPHRFWLLMLGLCGLVAVGALIVAPPLPSYQEVIDRIPRANLRLLGVPIVALAFPLYGVICIVLALWALARPASSDRFMGDLARRRARPWLVAASLVLLGYSLLVGTAMLWFLRRLEQRPPALYFLRALPTFMTFDLVLSLLVAAAVVLTGRAIVSYEIFTGKTLPRGGLRRHWRQNLILAAGYGMVIGTSLSITIEPIYRLLLATLLLAIFSALLSWRAYAEREHSMERLRVFAGGRRFYERLMQPVDAHDDAALPFQTLCGDVLGASVGYLVTLGPLAPFVGAPLVYGEARLPLDTIASLVKDLSQRLEQQLYLPLDVNNFGGASWAVPLWSGRGLIGALLLGEKRDGGLYTQEEIELARATGERLIDTQASAEMARRLLLIQRQRFRETQVLDRQTRRVLHDDVLPRLHAAMLLLSGASYSSRSLDSSRAEDPVALLTEAHHQIANLLRAIPPPVDPQLTEGGLLGALRQMVDRELAPAFDEVVWQITPEAEQATRGIPTFSAEVLIYAVREVIRNAARHARTEEPGHVLRLCLSIRWKNGLVIDIEDNGAGIASPAPAGGGSGQGLALHSTMLAVVGGMLSSQSVRGAYTRFSLVLPEASLSEPAMMAAEP